MHGATAMKKAEAALYEIGQIVGFVDLIGRQEAAIGFPMTETSKWYCAIVNPNCHARASLGLHELGYRSFYPRIRRWVSHARVKTAKEKPLLGRYIFVEVDRPAYDKAGRKIHEPRQSFGEVRSVNGIEGFVANPDPVQVPAYYVQRMRERYLYGEWDFVRQETCPFYAWNPRAKRLELDFRKNDPMPIGARIKIVEGEFSDMLATITSRRGHRIDVKLVGENRYSRLNDRSVRAA